MAALLREIKDFSWREVAARGSPSLWRNQAKWQRKYAARSEKAVSRFTELAEAARSDAQTADDVRALAAQEKAQQYEIAAEEHSRAREEALERAIRLEKDASRKTRPMAWVLFVGKRETLRQYTPQEYRDLARLSENEAHLVDQDETSRFWLVGKRLFVTEDAELLPEDVVALANEQRDRRRLQLERAHAVMAMRKRLDSSARRQPIPQQIKVAVWQRDGGRCVECGSQEELEFDHVIPLSLGGSNTERNLQLLCEPCNRRKGGTLG